MALLRVARDRDREILASRWRNRAGCVRGLLEALVGTQQNRWQQPVADLVTPEYRKQQDERGLSSYVHHEDIDILGSPPVGDRRNTAFVLSVALPA
jgi:hypothetical protein